MKRVVIIGAGLGGLVAGNLLVKKGHKVTLYEAHTAPGGYTSGFRRKGFYFESGTLSLEGTPTLYKALDDIGVRDEIRLVRKQDRFLSPYFDFKFESYAGFKKALYDAFPAEAKGLDGYFGEIDPACEAMRPFVGLVIPTVYEGPRRLVASLPYLLKGGPFMRLMKKYENTTSAQLADRWFPRRTALNRFLGGLAYPDSGIVILAGFFTMVAVDYWYVSDGMQHLADVLAEQFRKNGGDLRLGTKVTRIVTRRGRAAGVEAGGAVEEADDVISACDYKRTFTELLDDPSTLPAGRLEKIRNTAVSQGVFTVFLGLEMSGGELLEHMKNPGVSYDTYDEDSDPRDTEDPDLFAKAGFGLHSPSLINAALAPEGKSSLMIMTMAPAGWQNRWGGGDRERYRILKKAAMDALVARAEAVIPGLRSRLEFAEAATPLTYERYTGNTDGATSAWSWNPRERFYEKGVFDLVVDTPIRNLFIGSCWANQTGGIPGAIAAAYKCAQKIK
ncbi:MAG: NAD(P)/FAD-dependent oxidoreductase [Candidatus Aminicenantales bacterium]|jgi:phytoene dehydrogenase-like protein